MSSLIFYTDASQALVATDTLAVKPGGAPRLFCIKAIYLPHLRTIIAGTGLGMFAGDWANHVNNRLIVAGLRNLDYHTPDGSRTLWTHAKERDDIPNSLTTTVYQIGVSEDDGEVRAFAYRSANDFGEVRAFAYRSANDFESEPLGHGTRAKPECAFPSEGHLLHHLQPMMIEQRAIQDAMPPEDRLYIGGECVVMHLTKETCVTSTLFRFKDYADQLGKIFGRFEK